MLIFTLILVLVTFAHLACASFCVSRLYSLLGGAKAKYAVSRGLLLSGLVTAVWPAHALTEGAGGLSASWPWMTYQFFLALCLSGLLVFWVRRLRVSALWTQRLFWEAPARRLAADFRPPRHTRSTLDHLLIGLAGAVHRPVVREVVVPIARLPRSFSGLRILHLTDTHMGVRCGPEYYRALLPELIALEPDLVVHSGDLLSLASRAEEMAAWLGELGRHTRLGAFCIYGNHDLALGEPKLAAALRREKCLRLANRCKRLKHKGLQIGLLGSESPWNPVDELELAVKTMHKGNVLLWLGVAHGPDTGMRLVRSGMDLVFCGHTHGGQVRLGRLGPPVVTAKKGGRFPHGLYPVGRGLMMVSAGLGSYVPPGRFLCPPEAVLVVLCRGSTVR